MEAEFWHNKWERNEIAFHEGEANRFLKKHFDKLSLKHGSRIFVPLCGKTMDIQWLISQGCHVIGAELSKIAIEQLFSQLGIKPLILSNPKYIRYSSESIDIFVGNIFDLNQHDIGYVDAIYDRAALVAMPEAIRGKYVAHLMGMTKKATQLLISYDYNQKLIDGPPFSVNNEEITRYYQEHYKMTLLETVEVSGGLKGKCAAFENVWVLT